MADTDDAPKTFSFKNYADEFDAHIEKSIRGYSDLREDVIGMSKYFLESGTSVLDIGCSEGTLLERMAEESPVAGVNFIGCEIEDAFVEQWKKRIDPNFPEPSRVHESNFTLQSADVVRRGIGKPFTDENGDKQCPNSLYLVKEDITKWKSMLADGDAEIPDGFDRSIVGTLVRDHNQPFKDERKDKFSLVVSLFTMQFLPEHERLRLFKKIYDNLQEGGAFITSEKIFAHNAKVQNMMEYLYYDYKKKNFTEKEILDKEEQLRFLAKLTTENLLISQLRGVGFRGTQIF